MQDHAAATDVGRMREHNEDAHALVPTLDGYVCAVADGMGGHAAGEVASGLAIAAITAAARRASLGQPLLPLLEDAADDAHARIRAEAKDGRQGMGCTLTAAVVRAGHVEILHIGDSRAYLLTPEGISQLTEDDTLVGEMVRHQVLTAEDARRHPARSVLTRALGVGEVADFSTYERPVARGDVLLLCSDGLTTHVGDETIRQTVGEVKQLKDAARRLIELANEQGGSDNITVVLVRCDGPARR